MRLEPALINPELPKGREAQHSPNHTTPSCKVAVQQGGGFPPGVQGPVIGHGYLYCCSGAPSCLLGASTSPGWPGVLDSGPEMRQLSF